MSIGTRVRRSLQALLGNEPAQTVAPPSAPPAATDEQLALAERYGTRTFWHTLDLLYEERLATATLRCIVCGHEGKRDGFTLKVSECIFGGGRLERYACPNCQCIFGAQKFLDLPPDLVSLDYQLLYSRYAEGNTTDNEVRTFHSLGPKPDGVYVNWGCGAWNETVIRLRNEGHDLWGFEPSAAQTSGYVLKHKEELPRPIAGIFSNNVIEHFVDPVVQFREFRDLLPPGGKMAHSSPCYEYLYPHTRFHTVFLLGRSPEVLAERTGFKVVDRVVDGEYINVVFERLPD